MSYFRQISRLGVSLFFVKAKSEPSLVIRLIVYQLALFDASIGERILSKIDQGHRDALIQTSVQQFAFEPAPVVRVCIGGSSSGRRISLRVRCSTLCMPGMTWRRTGFRDIGTMSWPPSRRSLSLPPCSWPIHTHTLTFGRMEIAAYPRPSPCYPRTTRGPKPCPS